MNYTDFTIRARDWQGSHFKVEVTQSPVDRMRAAEEVAYPSGTARLLRSLERKNISFEQLRGLGEALAQSLLPPTVRHMLSQSLAGLGAQDGLRLRLVLDDARVANLPWEYIYWSRAGEGLGLDGFLALDPRLSLVRHEAMPAAPAPLRAGWPLKLVVGLAAPRDLPTLDLEAERTLIEEALGGVHGVEVVCVDHLTVSRLEAACQNAHIFHFAGHANFVWDKEERQGVGLIYLEDEAGERLPFPVQHLALTLRAGGVRLAVLGGCETGRRDGVNVWTGIAPALMQVGIPAAVAMQYTVYDDAAIAFARRFYQALAAGLSLDEAVVAGRLAMLNQGAPGDAEWGVPVLYMRSADGIIFPEVAADPALEPLRQQQRVTIGQRVAELHAELTGLEIAQAGMVDLEVTQEIDRVSQGGSVIGARIERLNGGLVQASQRVGEVSHGGRLVGVRFGGKG